MTKPMSKLAEILDLALAGSHETIRGTPTTRRMNAMERMNEIMKEHVEADEAFERCRELRQSLIDSLDSEMAIVGPVKIGDIGAAKGYHHAGKKMIVDHVRITNSWRGVGIMAVGRILKEDGTPGLDMAEYFIEVAAAP